MTVSRILPTLICILLLSGSGVAAPPEPEDMPRCQEVLEAVQEALAEAKAAEAEANRDHDREFLADYAAQRVGSEDDHKRIVGIIGNRKIERTKKGIRAEAAEIVKKRWPKGRKGSLADRRELTKHLIPLLKVSRRDDRGASLAIDVLNAMWDRPPKYDVTAKPRARRDAVKAWEKFFRQLPTQR